MTTDATTIALEAAARCFRHGLRLDAAQALRFARETAGAGAWTVQELRAAWHELKCESSTYARGMIHAGD